MTSTFKQYVKGQVAENDNPFSIRSVADIDWQDGGTVLYFPNSIFGHGSGSFKVKEGFVVTVRMWSHRWGRFASTHTAYRQEGYHSTRVAAFNTGLGGDSILHLVLYGGDSITVDSANSTVYFDLRRTESTATGGYGVTEPIGGDNISMSLIEVVRYTQATGDIEGETVEGSGPAGQTEFDPELNPTTGDDVRLDIVPEDERGGDLFPGIKAPEIPTGLGASATMVGLGLVVGIIFVLGVVVIAR